MYDQDYIRIPLYRRGGSVRAYALVDYGDGYVTRFRWGLEARGYVRWNATENGRQRSYLLHRVLLGLEHGDKREVDHINRDRLDNRRSNLRIVTRAQNNQNRSAYKGASSRFRGVCWDRQIGKWKANARLNGKTFHIGMFSDEFEAAEAARAFRLIHMPYTIEDGAP